MLFCTCKKLENFGGADRSGFLTTKHISQSPSNRLENHVWKERKKVKGSWNRWKSTSDTTWTFLKLQLPFADNLSLQPVSQKTEKRHHWSKRNYWRPWNAGCTNKTTLAASDGTAWRRTQHDENIRKPPEETFLDNDWLLWVGGRLLHSELPDTSKHPSLSKGNHHVVILLERHTHAEVLHGGIQMT